MKNFTHWFLQFRLKIALFLYDDLSNGHPIVRFVLDIAHNSSDIICLITSYTQ